MNTGNRLTPLSGSVRIGIVEYSDTISDTMLSAPRQAVLLAGSAAFGSTDRMAPTPQDTPCIETSWWRNAKGYGHGWVPGIGKILAHRHAWSEANGPIPEGMRVLHRCDNPPCISVDHLFLGTQRDNNQDCARKGRTARGEAHKNARLTESDVVAIRVARASGEATAELAYRYGVSGQTIAQVSQGRLWKHVGGPITPATKTIAFLSSEEVSKASRLHASGMSIRGVAAAIGRSAVAVKRAVGSDEAWTERQKEAA